jgi:hypothetical protein
MTTRDGARILYFVNDVDPESVIRSPIIIDANLLEWQPAVTPGVFTKELRKDPGNGASTWLMRVEAGAAMPWESSSAKREGYLLAGNVTQSECVAGEVVTGPYTPGGYFLRPPDTINGGPLSGGDTDVVWFLRETSGGVHEIVSGC